MPSPDADGTKGVPNEEPFIQGKVEVQTKTIDSGNVWHVPPITRSHTPTPTRCVHCDSDLHHSGECPDRDD